MSRLRAENGSCSSKFSEKLGDDVALRHASVTNSRARRKTLEETNKPEANGVGFGFSVVAVEVVAAVRAERHLSFLSLRPTETTQLDRLRETPVACPSEAAIRL
jgi:hypothetical protein